MWFKRFRNSRPTPEFSHQLALRPWGNAAYLSPHHLPLCIEGNAQEVKTATLGFVVAAQEQQVPIYVQEGMRPLLSLWPELNMPPQRLLPPIASGTTQETVRQTLAQVMDWLARDAEEAQPWPALLLCSTLGAHQRTVLDVLQTLNPNSATPLGLVYIHHTRTPPLHRPDFAAQLYCKPDGRAELRRHHGYHSFHLPSEVPAPFTAGKPKVPPRAHRSVG